MKSKSTLQSKQLSKTSNWPLLIIGLIFTCTIVLILEHFYFSSSSEFWRFSWLIVCLWSLITYIFYKSTGLICDFLVMMLLIWWLFKGVGHQNIAFTYLPFITAVWITVTQKINSHYFFPLAVTIPAIWFFYFNTTQAKDFHLSHYLYLSTCLSMLFIHIITYLKNNNNDIHKIDIILSSYSGNTAHYTDFLIQGVKQTSAEVLLHRFHYYKNFKPELKGDALIIAFPIFGCKPPWTFLSYLLFTLPKGKSKPAFILYTCIGGAENTGLLCWLILTLKGYNVTGRNWSVYPINVPTFRLGPRQIWKWFDSLSPIKWDLKEQTKCGKNFALGLPAGIPLIFGLTPCFLAGILLENKWLNTILYRNHVIKKRCNQCEICINYCPAQRLKVIDGYPKSEGECMICMGCVNLCPQNAMHLWGFTEYGNRYTPKYKKYIVRRKL